MLAQYSKGTVGKICPQLFVETLFFVLRLDIEVVSRYAATVGGQLANVIHEESLQYLF